MNGVISVAYSVIYLAFRWVWDGHWCVSVIEFRSSNICDVFFLQKMGPFNENWGNWSRQSNAHNTSKNYFSKIYILNSILASTKNNETWKNSTHCDFQFSQSIAYMRPYWISSLVKSVYAMDSVRYAVRLHRKLKFSKCRSQQNLLLHLQYDWQNNRIYRRTWHFNFIQYPLHTYQTNYFECFPFKFGFCLTFFGSPNLCCICIRFEKFIHLHNNKEEKRFNHIDT